MTIRARYSYLAFVILLLYAGLVLYYASGVPLLESSDEGAHFLYVHNLLADRALPVIESRAAIAEQESLVKRWSLESHQPPLYYLIGALLISPTTRNDIDQFIQPNPLIFLRGIAMDNANIWLHTVAPTGGDTGTAIWMLRLYSLVLSAGSLWLIYQTARLALYSERLALTAMLLVACIPTYVNIGGSVNNDNLVTLLYTAGVWWSLKTWRDGIRPRDMVLISLILTGIALTKITGLTLFIVVYLALWIGVRRGYYSVRQAGQVVVVSLILTGVLAGWWYLRNLTLYGDPLAQAATLALWGRQFAKPTESGSIVGEIVRIWESFWLMVGHLHLPVWGPTWGYVYATAITLIGAMGLALAGLDRFLPSSSPFGALFAQRKIVPETGIGSRIFLLVIAMLLPVVTLIIGTRSIDISYGRLLFPALVGFAPLLVYGWARLLEGFGTLLILPLALLLLTFPVMILAVNYPRLEPVASIPETAIPINYRVGDLTILAYQLKNRTVNPGKDIFFDLYLTGANPANPALLLTITDPITLEGMGNDTLYPGGAPTDSLQPGVIYRGSFQVGGHRPAPPTSPRQLKMQIGWQLADDPTYLPMTGTNGDTVSTLLLDASTLIDPRYQPSDLPEKVNATFGKVISLENVGLTGADSLQPGDPITVAMNWRTLKALDGEWSLTVQLQDTAGSLITQQDGALPGYPASAWRAGARIQESRTLTIPADTPPGAYRIAVGWYRLDDLTRLPAAGEGAVNDLVPLPDVVQVVAK